MILSFIRLKGISIVSRTLLVAQEKNTGIINIKRETLKPFPAVLPEAPVPKL
jgi:hypothetical protein